MSVQVILSSKQLELNSNNETILNLKASFSDLSNSTAALFKVRTNSKDMIDVRPSYGIMKDPNDNISTLNIRYLGKPQDIRKMKLQVSWVWGQGVQDKKLSHSQFSQVYLAMKQKLTKEKVQMVKLISNDLVQDSETLIFNQKSKGATQNQNQEFQQEKEQESIEQTLHHNQLPQPIKSNKKYTLKTVIIMTIIFFILGILTGIQIQKLINPPQSQQSLDQKSQEEPQEINKQEQIQTEVNSKDDSPQTTQPSAVVDDSL